MMPIGMNEFATVPSNVFKNKTLRERVRQTPVLHGALSNALMNLSPIEVIE